MSSTDKHTKLKLFTAAMVQLTQRQLQLRHVILVLLKIYMLSKRNGLMAVLHYLNSGKSKFIG